MSQSKASSGRVSGTHKDLMALGIGTVLVCLSAYTLDSNQIIYWLARHANSKVDEFIIALIAMTVGMSFFSFRRWRELNREIAERQRAEDSIRESEARFQRVVRATNDAVWDWDLSNNSLWWNEGIQTLFGYRAEDVEPTLEFWHKRLHPEDEGRIMASFYAVAETTKDSWSGEYRFRRADGSYANVFDRAFLIRDQGGKLARVTGAMMDVTERERAAHELQQAKTVAEAANGAKSEFLANMSHEIRTPLNGILGMSELALETELTAEQREYLLAVEQSAESLLTVINDILDFSKIEARKLDFDSVAFRLRETVEDAVRAVALAAHRKGLELACDVALDAPKEMTGDPSRLRQVIINLVGNAIKFTENGEVVLRVRCEGVDGPRARLHFSVSDTGIGIPAEKQAMIFEAFSQADTSTRRKFGGTGLGLTISAALVGMMGGRIWVESKVGAGSTFHFTACFSAATSEGATGRQSHSKELGGVRVLVVDDNATNCRILRDMLAAWQMDVLSVSGGRSALDALHLAKSEERPFALVLTDGHMPDINGFELALRIKHDPQLARTAILMLTSDKQRGDLERCRELGISAYLVKPVRQADLLAAVRGCLQTESATVRESDDRDPSADSASSRPLKILLAEDNPTNQTFAVRILEKRGHTVSVVSNGRRALAAVEHQEFDLILMDVQMPEMDGFEATAAIRKRESSTGLHIPIVAMTAHAMSGDRERCLSAGMDGYVSKPIRVQELLKTIGEQLDSPGVHRELSKSISLDKVDGDPELLIELVKIFLENYPRLLTALHQAIGDGNATLLTRTAHELKGSLGVFDAEAAFKLAQQLEQMGRAESLIGAAPVLGSLEVEITRLKSDFAEMLKRYSDKKSLKARAASEASGQ